MEPFSEAGNPALCLPVPSTVLTDTHDMPGFSYVDAGDPKPGSHSFAGSSLTH